MNTSHKSTQFVFIRHLLISILLSLVVFTLLHHWILLWMSAYHNQEDVSRRHHQDIAVAFQRYIMDKSISSHQSDAIHGWTQNRKYDLIIIHNTLDSLHEDTIYDSRVHKKVSSHLYTIEFADGNHLVTILHFSQHHYKNKTILFAFIGALITFTSLNILLFKKRMTFIHELRRKLEATMTLEPPLESELNYPHEILQIHGHIHQLTQQLKDYEQRETQRDQISNDLMASLSHDFKTPLTVIIGYLEIIKDSLTKNKSLVDKSIERAHYLQELIDDALYYFHSTTGTASKQQNEQVIFTDMLNHYCSYMSAVLSQEYQIVNHLTEDPIKITINEMMMNRLFDNLLSNMMKYAKRGEPIIQTNYIEDGWLIFEQTNTKDLSTINHPSTMLGLKTCKRIMTIHNGSFEIEETEQHFTTKLYFPL